MKILDIYKKYAITPMLQMHQLRAAAVGNLIADNWKNESLNKTAVVQTLLIHDMGNIIKFDLDNFPQLLGEEIKRIDFWKQTQKDFVAKYGTDEHKATQEIAKEIGVPQDVQYILSQLGSFQIEKAKNGNDYNVKLNFYADLRVAPFGIVNVNKRFDDIVERYKNRNHHNANMEKTEQNRVHTLEIEKQLQENALIPLAEISDQSINHYLHILQEFNF